MIPSTEMQQMLYNLMPMVGWFFATIFNFTQYKRKKEIPSYCIQSIQNRLSIKSNKSIYKILSSNNFLINLEILIISLLVYASTSLNISFGEIMKTGPNYFGFVYFLPIILIVICCVLWINPLKQIDLITPSLPLALFFVRHGCFFYGCCIGITHEYGLYNYRTEKTEIPVQLTEAYIALGLFIFLLWWRKKAKTGTLFPVYLILYSFLRFFNEFLCFWPGRYLMFFNRYQILCFFGVLLGLIELLIVLKYGEKISTYFDEKPYGFIKALFKKTKKTTKAK